MLLDKSELLGKSGRTHPGSGGLGWEVSEEIRGRLLLWWPSVAVGQPGQQQAGGVGGGELHTQ